MFGWWSYSIISTSATRWYEIIIQIQISNEKSYRSSKTPDSWYSRRSWKLVESVQVVAEIWTSRQTTWDYKRISNHEWLLDRIESMTNSNSQDHLTGSLSRTVACANETGPLRRSEFKVLAIITYAIEMCLWGQLWFEPSKCVFGDNFDLSHAFTYK